MKLLLISALLGLSIFAAAQDDADEADAGEADEEDKEAMGEDHVTLSNEEEFSSDQMRGLHKKIDANSNGQVSLAELLDYAHVARRALAKSELDSIVQKLDTNKDGKISLKEYQDDGGRTFAHHREESDKERKEEFEPIDENKDGFLEPEELTGMFHHHINDKVETKLTAVAMKDKDTNRNGALTIQEFYGHLADPEKEGAPVDEAEIPDEEKEIFRKLDLDNSGTLTLKELKSWESGAFHTEESMKQLFQAADHNKDNVLTADELDASKSKIASEEFADAHSFVESWVEHGEL
jgi:Ca2+-binding EF-hand superfamily protein